ncbi:hypothetical protein PENNAL_c0032G03300 [Penicillium nalgiovense]|uniref:Uncharacterized protein n=1 Tax=Penicillium nalgiovense TaxID=60175 RepID=A0A1V6Y7W6_PENNA|nr:hypothetical protein PENNAL_c0032G03300 [Penicillium nalgiovense]
MPKDKFDTVVECTTRDSDIKKVPVLGRVFEAEGVDIRFADFKAAGIGYSKTPDTAMVSRNGPPTLKAVGELKTPWVVNHQLSKWYPEEQKMRHTIGQVVEYMLDQKLPYGCHSTYEETIFLHLVRVNGTMFSGISPSWQLRKSVSKTSPKGEVDPIWPQWDTRALGQGSVGE